MLNLVSIHPQPRQRRCVFRRDRVALARCLTYRIFFGGFGVCQDLRLDELSTECDDVNLTNSRAV